MNCEMRGTASADTAPNSQRTDDTGITSLVLTRREGEAVVVDDGRVVVRVSAIQGKKVRLQFLAPGHVRILREEIYDSRCALATPHE